MTFEYVTVLNEENKLVKENLTIKNRFLQFIKYLSRQFKQKKDKTNLKTQKYYWLLIKVNLFAIWCGIGIGDPIPQVIKPVLLFFIKVTCIRNWF